MLYRLLAPLCVVLMAVQLVCADAHAATSVKAQAYSACSAAAASDYGVHVPRLCACVARTVAASRPKTRAAAVVTGRAAARVCFRSVGLN